MTKEPNSLETKSAQSRAFLHYLRTGEGLTVAEYLSRYELKYNHNHDPVNGRFTSGPGGKGNDRQWPVAGNGQPAKRGTTGPNGKPYADGRYDPSGASRNGRPHYGIDLPAYPGQPVGAAADGKVMSEGNIPGYGNTVAILNPDGNVSMYAHLSDFGNYPVGSDINAGDIIGFSGNTGNAANYGTHVHFEVRKYIGAKNLGKVSNGAQPIDPTQWVEGQ